MEYTTLPPMVIFRRLLNTCFDADFSNHELGSALNVNVTVVGQKFSFKTESHVDFVMYGKSIYSMLLQFWNIILTHEPVIPDALIVNVPVKPVQF